MQFGIFHNQCSGCRLVTAALPLTEAPSSAERCPSAQQRHRIFHQHERGEYAMKFGVVFPQTEKGSDPVALRDFAQAVEGLGYDYILIYDHVLGASTENRPGWSGYSSESQFHEPFVLFGYLAGCTRTLGFATGVLVLPQRQTALVAKQAFQASAP